MSAYDAEEPASAKSRHDGPDSSAPAGSLSALSVTNSETPGCGDSSDIVMSISDATRAGEGSVYSSSASERAAEEEFPAHLRSAACEAGPAKATSAFAHTHLSLEHHAHEGGARTHQSWQGHNSNHKRRPDKKRHALGSRATVQHVTSSAENAVCDVDVFRSSAAPCLQSSLDTSCQDMTLADLWRFFEDGSLFGSPVHTAGSALGPSTAYFVPLLSAMRLFATEDAVSAQSSAGSVVQPPDSRYTVKANRGPQAHLLALFNNSKLPWDRAPMTQELEQLSEQCPSPAVPHPAALMTTRLEHVHPSSWFAVWWQPVYRIPDMPLDAKFLAYYSFRSLFFELHKRVSPKALQMPIAGMISSAVQPLPPVRGAPPPENWVQLRSPTHPAQELPPAVRSRAERRLQQDLRELHASAQQLSCDCGKEIAVLMPDGRTFDGLEHSDFTFLQRGRMGGSTMS